MGISNVSIFLFMGIKTIETHTHVCEWVSEWSSLCCVWLCNFMDCLYIYISSVQSLSHVPTLCNPMDCMQHPRLPCPSPTLRTCSNLCPSSRWCHTTISSSVIPFSFCFQPFPSSGSFQMNQLFSSGGQSIGVSASISVLPMNTQDSSPLEWTGWCPYSPRDSQDSSLTSQFKSINSIAFSFL